MQKHGLHRLSSEFMELLGCPNEIRALLAKKNLIFEVIESGSKRDRQKPQLRKEGVVIKTIRKTTKNLLLSRMTKEETIYNKSAKEACKNPAF